MAVECRTHFWIFLDVPKIEASQNIQVCFFGTPMVWGPTSLSKKNTYQSSIYYILIILSLCCGEEDLSRIEIASAALSVWIYANLVYPLFLLFFPVQISNWYPLWSHNFLFLQELRFIFEGAWCQPTWIFNLIHTRWRPTVASCLRRTQL